MKLASDWRNSGRDGFRWFGKRGLAVLLVAGLAILLGRMVWHHFRTPPITAPVLRWGGDKEGGAPYIFEEGAKLRGFEVELAAYLARQLGLQDQFMQGYWDYLPQLLERGNIDIVLNGYEWSPQREQTMASTIPYYIYRIQLVVGPQSTIRSWEDLRGKRVGVLSDTAAHKYLQKTFGNKIEIVALSEEGTTGVFNMVRAGKQLDATVQDLAAALYYVKQDHGFGDLRMVGEPIEPGFYVIYLRKDESGLRERLNDALRAGIHDGTLRTIYERYGLWNSDQEDLVKTAYNWPPQVEYSSPKLSSFALLLSSSALTTVVLACLSMPLAMLIGLLAAVGRLYGPRWLDWLLGAYVELLRGTPLLMQLFVIYFLLPRLNVNLPALVAGILGLAINYSAYEAENYRAGLMAIPKGQMEAALSLGMNVRTALWRIIVPQAVRIVIPPVTNDFIALFKDTSVCSVIGVLELTGRYRGLMVDNPNYMLQVGVLTALLYLLMSYPLSILARRLERRYPRVIL